MTTPIVPTSPTSFGEPRPAIDFGLPAVRRRLRGLAWGAFWLAALVGLPACLGSTNVFLETFDRWPSRISFPPGGATLTNLAGNNALRLAASWPAVTGSTWASCFAADGEWDLFKWRRLERRIDLPKFTGTADDYVDLYCCGFSAEVLTSYLFVLGQQQVVLVKYLPHPGALARFICEDVTFPLVLQWTPGADRYVIERCADLAVPDWTPFLTTAATEVSLPRTERQEFDRVKLGP